MRSIKNLGLSATFLSLMLSAPCFAEVEGITVHGQWEITVREADGQLVETRQFENRLDGEELLIDLLSGLWTVELVNGEPNWSIIWGVEPDRGEELLDTGDCRFYRSDSPRSQVPGGIGLTTVSRERPNFISLSLTVQRTIAVPRECMGGDTFTVAVVKTFLTLDATTENNGRGRQFSSKQLPESEYVTVLPDQVVTFKVTYNFE